MRDRCAGDRAASVGGGPTKRIWEIRSALRAAARAELRRRRLLGAALAAEGLLRRSRPGRLAALGAEFRARRDPRLAVRALRDGLDREVGALGLIRLPRLLPRLLHRD